MLQLHLQVPQVIKTSQLSQLLTVGATEKWKMTFEEEEEKDEEEEEKRCIGLAAAKETGSSGA